MGIFDRFQKPKSVGLPTIEPPGTHLAFVLLPAPVLLDGPTLMAAMANYRGPELRLSPDQEEGGPLLSLDLAGVGTAFVLSMPHPIPDEEAEASFPYSIGAMGEGETLEPHQAHLVVTKMAAGTDLNPGERLSAFTSLLAAICEASSAVGVYWGNGGVTHRAETLLTLASDPDPKGRIMLWNGFSRRNEPGGKISLLSRGMNQLGLPDLYFITPMTEPGEVIGRFFGLLSYIADRGEAIPEGDTVGEPNNQRIQVTYVPSPANDGSVVWRVEF